MLCDMCQLFSFAIPCFDSPPDWWRPLSNLTGWFNWDAIGAVSTAGALYLTIRLATEARRDRRHREGVLLATAASVLRPALLSIGSALGQCATADLWNEDGRPYLESRLREDRIDERMREIKPFDLPSIYAAEWYQDAQIALANIRDEEAATGSDWEQAVRRNMAQLQLNITKLEAESDRRSRHLLRRLARCLHNSLNSRTNA